MFGLFGLTDRKRQELMNAAQGNAKMIYLFSGADMAEAMKQCQESHKLPPLSEERALYVGAFMDTIHRLSTQKQ
jgi:hypothetical protein